MSVSGYEGIKRTVSVLHPMISQAAKETCKKKITHKTTVFKHHRAESVELLFLRQEPNHLSSTTAQAQAEVGDSSQPQQRKEQFQKVQNI